jgi:hypothetical protein
MIQCCFAVAETLTTDSNRSDREKRDKCAGFLGGMN